MVSDLVKQPGIHADHVKANNAAHHCGEAMFELQRVVFHK